MIRFISNLLLISILAACSNGNMDDFYTNLQSQQREQNLIQKKKYKEVTGIYSLSPKDESGHKISAYIEEIPIHNDSSVEPGVALAGTFCVDYVPTHKSYAWHFSDGIYDDVNSTLVADITADNNIRVSCTFTKPSMLSCAWVPQLSAGERFNFILERTNSDIDQLSPDQIKKQVQCQN